jgi:hypothetical protein
MNDRDQDKRLDGPDVLHALSHGDTIDEIKLAALDEARALYGDDAPLQIEQVGSLNTGVRRSKGRFFAYVIVRCLQLPEGW